MSCSCQDKLPRCSSRGCEITLDDGVVALVPKTTLEAYPWDKCIADQIKRGYSKERAQKICGFIKSQNQSGERADRVLVNGESAAKWIHVATEGEYAGHAQGKFELTPEVFRSFIANFRADPRYHESDSTGYGDRPVLPFDYEHASEMSATDGAIPTTGAPAPAWALELEMRTGPDGAVQLWALTDLGDQIRGQIQRREYRYVSIAFVGNMPDFQSGEDLGPALTSIAFTNHPFLRNLEPLAASSIAGIDKRHGAGLERDHSRTVAAKGSDPMNVSLSAIAAAAGKAKIKITTLATPADGEAAVGQMADNSAALSDVLSALGVSDVQAALKAIPELVAARQKLSDALSQIDSLLSAQAAQDEAMTQAEVDAAMSVHFPDVKLHDKMRPALLALRKNDKAEFSKQYPIPEKAHAHLLGTYLAGKNGKQQTAPVEIAERAASESSRADVTRIDLRAYPGRNDVERIMAYIRGSSPESAKLSQDALVTQAGMLRRNPAFEFVT